MKRREQVGIGSIVKTLITPEGARTIPIPLGSIGMIIEKERALWVVAFPLPFVDADGSIWLHDEGREPFIHGMYEDGELEKVFGVHPTPSTIVAISDEAHLWYELMGRDREPSPGSVEYIIIDMTECPSLSDKKEEQYAWMQTQEPLLSILFTAEDIEQLYDSNLASVKETVEGHCERQRWHVLKYLSLYRKGKGS